ncbi:MAG: GTP-binding protein [Candidatus Heimdallarchaeota archaeon]|nr:MAG: GTP-binding protein [Candidatus Heimdallarchaeota archaeon]
MIRTTIAITGLQNAGKTSFSQRLITGSYIISQPTYGVDVEFTQYRGVPIQIWDMGGHASFRKHIWQNYVQQSSALIFIFDASDLLKMEESAEWFWNCYSWIEEKQVPILFLANKWDLVGEEDETIEKIVSGFNLKKISEKAIETPFRFFFVSVKTGAFISDAMNWLIGKSLSQFNKQRNNVTSFDFFIRIDDYIAHLHDNTEQRKEVLNLISVYKKKWLGTQGLLIDVLEEIIFEDYKIIFISQKDRAILISTRRDFVEQGVFGNLIKNITLFDTSEDINNFYLILEETKKELEKYFQTEIASSLSCDVSSFLDDEIRKWT